MFPSPSLPWFELARFRRNRLTRAALIAVMLVPLFYGALYVWANLNPTGNLDNVRTAVVNEDQLVEVTGPDGKKQPVAVGRLLAGNLISNDSHTNYDWQLTDAEDAREGLADGSYKAVLTIPKNLSKAATSTGGDDPATAIQGNLDLQTNDAVNYINGTIAQTILKEAKSALNAQVTETYLDNVFLSFSDIKMALNDAADGAGKLADGAGELADGNRKLADGAGQLESGSAELASGLGTLSSSTRTLPRDTQRLADGSKQVANGTAEINTLVQSVVGRVDAVTDDANGRIDNLTTTLNEIAADCAAQDTPPPFCADITEAAQRSHELKPIVGEVAGRAHEISGQTQQLSDGAAQVAAGNAKLAAGMPKLVGGISQASTGAKQLADGTRQLSDGADKAATGAEALSSGALKLQAGLRQGGDKVPDYNADEREQLAKTAATPVTEAAKRVNAVTNNGEALAPYFMALALWVGAMAIYLLLRPLSERALASTASSTRIALAGFAPGVLISAIQALLLVAVLEFVVGINPASHVELIGIALATGVVFTAINQMFIAVFGGAGRFLALVFVCLQLTAAGGTYPIETAPSFFGFLHDLLPMSYAVDGFRAATAGGGVGIGKDLLALAVFTVLALSVTIITAQRQRMVTMKRLHPTLAV